MPEKPDSPESQSQIIPVVVTNATSDSSNAPKTENKIWSRYIPVINIGVMIVSAIFVFGIDLSILIQSPGLILFWIEMLVVFSIYFGFLIYENRGNKFRNSKSPLDIAFLLLVIVRDFIFFLNFIPVIQIGGGIALFSGGIPYLLVYLFLIKQRSKVKERDVV